MTSTYGPPSWSSQMTLSACRCDVLKVTGITITFIVTRGQRGSDLDLAFATRHYARLDFLRGWLRNSY